MSLSPISGGGPGSGSGGGGIGGSTGSDDNRLLRSDGTGGATVQASPITCTDGGALTGVTTIAATSATFSGSPIAAGYLVYDGGPGGDEKVQISTSFLLSSDTVITWYDDPDISSGTAGPSFRSGAGSPEGVVTAKVGSLYLRRDGGAGTCLYVKESGTGNTGWVAK